MKILIVNAMDINGGAARAAYRLKNALSKANVTVQMLVQTKESDDKDVLIIRDTRLARFINRMRPALDALPKRIYKNRSKVLFSSSWLPSKCLTETINSLAPDLVHLHWINNGMLSLRDIEKINAPVVMSMHDMWLFTGGCHYSGGCDGYKDQCGRCPVLGSTKKRDLSWAVWKRKRSNLARRKRLHIVGVSRWISGEAMKSSLFVNKNIQTHYLPNLINTDVFAPVDKDFARKLLGLPLGRKLIIFGAIDATKDSRKGFEELTKALKQIKTDNVEIVVFGASCSDSQQMVNQKCHYIGKLNDEISLRLAYSAADVMVVPSSQEAFGQTAAEAMACGTPVVAFGATGLLDIVDHLENGFLAEPYMTNSLAEGIDFILNSQDYPKLSAGARQKVIGSFDSAKVVRSYIDLYNNIIEGSSKNINR